MIGLIIAALSEIGFSHILISEGLNRPHHSGAVMQLDTEFDEGGKGDLDALEVTNRICGEAVARRLLAAFDGERLYFPVAPSPDHPISQVIGHENAKLIGKEIGMVTLYVGQKPNERRWNIVKWASLAGLPKRAIVRLTGYRESHVYCLIAKMRAAGHLPQATPR